METKKHIFCALDFSNLELTLSFAKKIKDQDTAMFILKSKNSMIMVNYQIKN